ncbi:MAG: prolipoprotein diacylglyceryl transferase [Dongiales bacterium]
MSPSGLHSLFEALAWAAALAVGWWTRRHEFAAVPLPMAGRRYPVYLLVLWLGAVAGAYGLGSLNVALAGVAGEGRSILGAIVGGVIAAEIYKGIFGIRGSTGAVLVLPLAVAIAIGRIGCFLAGLPDYTYGTPSDLPWAVDFGDGIPRHPVQLYESLTMALFALGFFLWLRRRPLAAASYGFYVFAGFYGLQRFLWEFLKPYPEVVGPFNVFHLAAGALVIYAAVMLRVARPVHAVA